MGGARAQIERDLGLSLEGDFGQTIVLFDPEGHRHAYSANDPTKPLQARVTYEYQGVNAQGLPVTVHSPRVTVRLSSLDRVPLPGETWGIQFPKDPVLGAPNSTYEFKDKPVAGGRSIGFLVLFPTKAKNSDPVGVLS